MHPVILVVDDDPISRQVIIDILDQSGDNFQMLIAENGDEAERIAIESVPDAVLMDWQMPGISGVDVIKRLKENEITKDIPVLMVTSVAYPDKLKEAFDAGAVDYITKPVKKIELLVRVKSVLRTSQYYKEILLQKQEIEAQKKDITDSIRYARDIQAAILPKEEEIQSFLPHSFVLFKPKDIVSGDFYWFHASPTPALSHYTSVGPGEGDQRAGTPLPSGGVGGGLIFLAVCDCTGHGVPGAFVSMVGNDLLNQIIIEKEVLNPAEVLSLLNMGMNSVFIRTKVNQQSYADTVSANRSSENPSGQNWGSEIKDGMDMVLCTFNDDLSKLEFAGARNPLYYVRDGILTEIKGDKQPIGGRTDLNCIFTKHELKLQRGDTIYMFSDGYGDQLGGPREKKFMAKKFKQLLVDINDKNLNEQKQILDRTTNEWKGGMDQIDDILVIGVKIQ